MIGCYLIYSDTLKRFYIGISHDLIARIEKHKVNFYGKNHFTSKANDWKVELFIECENFAQAVRIERHIKSMKSSKYNQNLINYPELVQKIKDRFKEKK